MAAYVNRSLLFLFLLSGLFLAGCDFTLGGPTPTLKPLSAPPTTLSPVLPGPSFSPTLPGITAPTAAATVPVAFTSPPEEGQIASLSAQDLYKRGLSSVAVNNPDLALEQFSQSLMLDPNFAPAYLSRARLYISEGLFSRALTDCDAALKLEPDAPITLYLRGVTRLNVEDYAGSLADFSYAEKQGYKDADLLLARGAAYEWSGKADTAATIYKEAVASGAGSDTAVSAYRGLVRTYINKGDYPSATETAHTALALYPEEAALYAERARVYIHTGDYAKAQADLDMTLNKSSNMISTAYLVAVRGELDAATGQIVRAKSDAQKALRLSHDTVVHNTASRLLARLEK